MVINHAIFTFLLGGCYYTWPIVTTYAWTSPIRTSKIGLPFVKPNNVTPSRLTSLTRFMVESFDLKPYTKLSEIHEDVGQELAESVQRMLDSEWMPQEIHRKIGQSVKKSYVQCRETGQSDLMTIMTTVADSLNERWDEFNADAFVNAWDVANYVSDWLTVNAGEPGCNCTQKIY